MRTPTPPISPFPRELESEDRIRLHFDVPLTASDQPPPSPPVNAFQAATEQRTRDLAAAFADSERRREGRELLRDNGGSRPTDRVSQAGNVGPLLSGNGLVHASEFTGNSGWGNTVFRASYHSIQSIVDRLTGTGLSRVQVGLDRSGDTLRFTENGSLQFISGTGDGRPATLSSLHTSAISNNAGNPEDIDTESFIHTAGDSRLTLPSASNVEFHAASGAIADLSAYRGSAILNMRAIGHATIAISPETRNVAVNLSPEGSEANSRQEGSATVVRLPAQAITSGDFQIADSFVSLGTGGGLRIRQMSLVSQSQNVTIGASRHDRDSPVILRLVGANGETRDITLTRRVISPETGEVVHQWRGGNEGAEEWIATTMAEIRTAARQLTQTEPARGQGR